jgi:hypothetical protein
MLAFPDSAAVTRKNSIQRPCDGYMARVSGELIPGPILPVIARESEMRLTFGTHLGALWNRLARDTLVRKSGYNNYRWCSLSWVAKGIVPLPVAAPSRCAPRALI